MNLEELENLFRRCSETEAAFGEENPSFEHYFRGSSQAYANAAAHVAAIREVYGE